MKCTPLEYINEMIIWKFNLLINLNNGGIMHSFSNVQIENQFLLAVPFTRETLLPHFLSKHLKNECIIPAALLKRINGSIF